jgi:tRNA modification GTPase
MVNRHAGLPPELLSLDLRSALSALGEVTGETSTDEVLDHIFSSFCIGK